MALASPYFHMHADPASAKALTPLQVAKAYKFPLDVDGTGERIAIIELGGGYTQSDLDTFFSSLHIPTPHVTSISIQGAENAPGGDADGEVLLDIQVAGAVAPGAVFDVYFCPNTDAGFLAGITAAIDSGATAISISWGAAESEWTHTSMLAFDAEFKRAANLGIPVFVASGDSGADDGTKSPIADFPASSPNVIACGGTRLVLNGDGTRSTEVVWNDGPNSAGGGGFSRVFTRPAWQPSGLGTYRGVPDLSGNADPSTGFNIFIHGAWQVVGGTSGVAPTLAAFAALLAQKGCTGLAQIGQVGYANGKLVYDVVLGNNRGFSAGTGWDPASGAGVPIGSAFVSFLAPAQPAPPVTPTPPPAPAPDPTPVPDPTPTPPAPPVPDPTPVGRPDGADFALAATFESWLNTRGIGVGSDPTTGKARFYVIEKAV